MSYLMMRKWFHEHSHLPKGHNTVVRIEHLFHSERFWAMVAIGALLLMFAAIVIWAGASAESNPDINPIRPFYPFTP